MCRDVQICIHVHIYKDTHYIYTCICRAHYHHRARQSGCAFSNPTTAPPCNPFRRHVRTPRKHSPAPAYTPPTSSLSAPAYTPAAELAGRHHQECRKGGGGGGRVRMETRPRPRRQRDERRVALRLSRSHFVKSLTRLSEKAS
jgi:hypothetical protein